MRTSIIIIIAGALGLTAACGQVSTEAEPTTSTQLARAVPTTTVAAPAGVPTPGAPSTATPGQVVTTTLTPRTTTPRAPTTTTTRPLTRAEATSRLCAAVASADEAIQRGSFVSGGLRLSGGIGATEKAADPAVLAAVRSMLRAGLDGDPDGYATARRAASTACAKAGFPIQLGGPIMCVQAPCP